MAASMLVKQRHLSTIVGRRRGLRRRLVGALLIGRLAAPPREGGPRRVAEHADVDANGIQFRASEEASSFVEALRTNYAATLKKRAEWLAKYLLEKSDADLAALITDRIGRWAVEFLGEAGGPGSL